MATLLIPTPLRKYTENSAKFETNAITVDAAIEELIEAYPGIKPHILDNDGKLRSFIKVFVGENDIRTLDGGETMLADSVVVSIVPAIAGGI
jgi:molybdopterin converting factor small subunit